MDEYQIKKIKELVNSWRDITARDKRFSIMEELSYVIRIISPTTCLALLYNYAESLELPPEEVNNT